MKKIYYPPRFNIVKLISEDIIATTTIDIHSEKQGDQVLADEMEYDSTDWDDVTEE